MPFLMTVTPSIQPCLRLMMTINRVPFNAHPAYPNDLSSGQDIVPFEKIPLLHRYWRQYFSSVPQPEVI